MEHFNIPDWQPNFDGWPWPDASSNTNSYQVVFPEKEAISDKQVGIFADSTSYGYAEVSDIEPLETCAFVKDRSHSICGPIQSSYEELKERSSFFHELTPFLDESEKENLYGPSKEYMDSTPIKPQKAQRRHSVPDMSGSIYVCPWEDCKKSFNRFYNLRSHYRTHTQEKPFVCGTCDLCFARNHDLKRHERTHSYFKPFQCPQCSRAFSRNDALNRHINGGSCVNRRRSLKIPLGLL